MSSIDEVSLRLGELKGSMDALTGIVKTHVEQQGVINDKIDKRIGLAEGRIKYWSGGATAIGAVLGLFLNSMRH